MLESKASFSISNREGGIANEIIIVASSSSSSSIFSPFLESIYLSLYLIFRFVSRFFFFPFLFLLSLFFFLSFFFIRFGRSKNFFLKYSKIDQRWIFHRWHVTTLFLRFFRLLSSYQIRYIFIVSLLLLLSLVACRLCIFFLSPFFFFFLL